MNVVEDPSEMTPAYEPEPSEPVPDTVIPPPEAAIVVEPEYVFAPDNVKVPAPDFVTVPDPVAIAPETVIEPAPPYVELMFVPDTPPDNVNVDASDMTVEAPVNVTRPEMVFAPETLRTAPFDETPEPVTEIASASVIPPESSSAAPEVIDVVPALVPSEPEFFAATTPA